MTNGNGAHDGADANQVKSDLVDIMEVITLALNVKLLNLLP